MARKQKTVTLDGLEPIAVKEITAPHIPVLLGALKEMRFGGLDVEGLVGVVTQKWDEVSDVVVECLSIDRSAFDQLGAFDLTDVLQAWVEVNAPFFDRIKALADEQTQATGNRPQGKRLKK